MNTGDDWGDSGPTFDDSFAFDGESYGEEELSKGGGGINKEGYYHFEVSEVTPELETVNNNGKPKAAQILFTMTVLESVEGQSPAGTKLFHRINLNSKDGSPPAEGSVKAALRLGVALGILEVIEADSRTKTVLKGTTTTRIPSSYWLNAKGRQVIGHVKFEQGDPAKGYKDRYAVPFGDFWHPGDPEMASVKKNAVALAAAGIVAGVQAVGAAATAEAKAAVAAAPAPDDDLGDL